MNEKFRDTDLREALRRNYANVPQLPASSLTLRPPQGKKELKRRRFPLFWRGLGAGLPIAASILIAFLIWPKGDEAPITQPEIQQPVVAKASPVPSQGGVNIAEAHEPQPQPQPAAEAQPSPTGEQGEGLERLQEESLLAESHPSPSGEQGEGLERLQEESLPLLAEAQPSPSGEQGEGLESLPLLAEAQPSPSGEQGEGLENLPPERQALVDIYLAEEALQVAYKQQEQTQELRAFTARLQGKEPETSHLITAF